MSEQLSNVELINEIFRNAKVAMQSINDITSHIEDESLKLEVQEEYEGYEKYVTDISLYMKERDYKERELGVMKKAMMWSAINMNTLMDNSTSHIAELMIKGTTMGLTELYAIVNGETTSQDDKIIEYAKNLIELEEKYIEKLKTFL